MKCKCVYQLINCEILNKFCIAHMSLQFVNRWYIYVAIFNFHHAPDNFLFVIMSHTSNMIQLSLSPLLPVYRAQFFSIWQNASSELSTRSGHLRQAIKINFSPVRVFFVVCLFFHVCLCVCVIFSLSIYSCLHFAFVSFWFSHENDDARLFDWLPAYFNSNEICQSQLIKIKTEYSWQSTTQTRELQKVFCFIKQLYFDCKHNFWAERNGTKHKAHIYERGDEEKKKNIAD